MRAGLVLWLGLVAARPGVAQDRWQLTLNSGTTLWDLRLVGLAGDTLVVRHADSTYAFPLAQVDEIRLVQKATRISSTCASGNEDVESAWRTTSVSPASPTRRRSHSVVPLLSVSCHRSCATPGRAATRPSHRTSPALMRASPRPSRCPALPCRCSALPCRSE